jgi:hypothetical protein
MTSFAPPPPPPPPAPYAAWGYGPQIEVKPIRGLALAITILLALQLLIVGLYAVAVVHRHRLANELTVDRFLSDDWFDKFTRARTLVGLFGFGVFAVTITLFVLLIVWSHRMQRNCDALGRVGRTWSAGWAIGGWFLPAANAVIPFLLLAETWRASEPGAGPGVTWKRARSGSWMWIWPIAYTVSVMALALTPSDSYEYQAGYGYGTYDRAGSSVVGAIVNVVAVIAAMAFVRALTNRHEAMLSVPQPPYSPTGYVQQWIG